MLHPRGGNNSERSGVVLIRDIQDCLPLTKLLGAGDLLYLLTPAVRPPVRPDLDDSPTDPFEPLGRALAAVHTGIRIRHIPYMVRDGITQYHINHLALAKAVIFVITGPPLFGQPSQVALSQVVRSLIPNRPQIVLVCCSIRELGPSDAYFPTLIESENFSVDNLQSAAAIIFGSRTSRFAPRVPRPPAPFEFEPSQVWELDPMNSLSSNTRWLVQEWDTMRDAPAIHLLWCECLPERFHIESTRLLPLLNRIGYSKHFVVRDPASGALVGFCATFTTYIDNRDNSLVGCIAVIIVQPGFRRRGIGSSLYHQALRQLAAHRVSRLQLGTAFPRLLYGPLIDPETDEWFRKRGWRIDDSGMPGCGQEVCDWILDFHDWRVDGLQSSGLTFRQCQTHELDQVLEFVVRESRRRENVGWYDQYCQLAAPTDIHDILLVLEGNTVLASAITYVPQRANRVSENLPWAQSISNDVGGVACICVTDDLPATRTRDSVMIRLLNYCVDTLKEQGMRRMFLDAILGGYEGFQSIGFQKWARYRDVWRNT